MSELKAFDVGLGRYTEDGYPCVVAFDADQNPRVLDEKVYLKSEADEVISKLKESVKKLILDNYLNDKELRHHKYKRCLAMAKWCDTKADWYYGIGRSFRDRVEFYIKWHKRWLELAEQFKEAK